MLAGNILIILAYKSIYNLPSNLTLYFEIFWSSGNDVFSHVIAMFVNVPFNKEDRILIKSLYLLKKMST